MIKMFIAMTLLGLCLKTYAFYYIWKNINYSAAMLACCILLGLGYLVSIIELIVYYWVIYFPASNPLLLLKLYTLSIVSVAMFLPVLVYAVIKNKNNVIHLLILALVFLLFSGCFLFTDNIVIDVVYLDHTITRVPGKYYGLFQLFIASVLVLPLFSLYKLFKNSDSAIEKIKAMNLIIGFMPMVFIFLVIILLMQLGVFLNTMGILPIMIGIKMLSIVVSAKTQDVLDLSTYLPWTKKAKQLQELTQPFRLISDKPQEMKKLTSVYEDSLLDLASNLFDKQKEAAQWLSTSEAKMSRYKKSVQNNA